MGKGTIISGGAGGLYQVQVNYERTRYDAQIAGYNDLKADLEAKAAAEPDPSKKAIIELQVLSVDKAIAFTTSSMPADFTIAAWCADLTADLSGVVGTVEVPGELTYIQIQPGYGGNATYAQGRDGQLLPMIAQDPAQAFYNRAVLPGWQKWMPLSRYGTITSISGDTADVTLEELPSSQQSLVINQTPTLSAVPIDYMDCDGSAFAEDDEVLVVFTSQDWDVPRIVGFKDNPKGCDEYLYITCIMASGSGPKVDCCIVWDLNINGYAVDVVDNGGDPAVFPVEVSAVSDWVSARSQEGAEAVAISGGPAGDGRTVFATYDYMVNTEEEVRDEGDNYLGREAIQIGTELEVIPGINYLGETDQEAYGSINLVARLDKHDQQSITDRTELYACDINAKNIPNFLIESNTTQGGTRARTASGEYTTVWDYDDCAIQGIWPCEELFCQQYSLRRLALDYIFKSPFTGNTEALFGLLSEKYYKSFCDDSVCIISTEEELINDQNYSVKSVMFGKQMALFYFEELISWRSESICGQFETPYSLGDLEYCSGNSNFPCTDPDPDITYFNDVPFTVKAFSHVIPEESGDLITDVNPFEIAANTALSTAIAGLKTYAETFSGSPAEGACANPNFTMEMVR